MLVKTFVSLRVIVGIDEMFAGCVSPEIRENAKILNDLNLIKMSKVDNNTTIKVFKRCFRRDKICFPSMWLNTFLSLLVNVWFAVMTGV